MTTHRHYRQLQGYNVNIEFWEHFPLPKYTDHAQNAKLINQAFSEDIVTLLAVVAHHIKYIYNEQ